MKGTGIFITEEERKGVEIEQSCSGMFLSGGRPMGDPGGCVKRLSEKYNTPDGTALNLKTGEFVYP